MANCMISLQIEQHTARATRSTIYIYKRFYVIYFKTKNAFLTFFISPTFFLLIKALASSSDCNNMQLKETCFFDV